MDRQKPGLQISITLGTLAQNKEDMPDLVKESWRDEGHFLRDKLLKSCCQLKFKDNEDRGKKIKNQ